MGTALRLVRDDESERGVRPKILGRAGPVVVVHDAKPAHSGEAPQSRVRQLNVRSSSKREAALGLFLEVINQAAAEHGLNDADLAAVFDRASSTVGSQLRGERAFPAEQLLLLPDEAFETAVDGMREARTKRRVK